jgi:hypothetical protein
MDFVGFFYIKFGLPNHQSHLIKPSKGKIRKLGEKPGTWATQTGKICRADRRIIGR